MSFPISPTNGQIVVLNSIKYTYSSGNNTWTRVTTSGTQSTTFNGLLTVNQTVAGYNGIVVTGSISGNSTSIKTVNTDAGPNSFSLIMAESGISSPVNVALVAQRSPAYTGLEVSSADFYIRGGQTDKDIYIATNYNQNAIKVTGADKTVRIYSTVTSTSTTTGALTVDGGVGVGGSIYGGGDLIIAGTPGSAKTFTLSPNASGGDVSTQNVTINLGNPAGGNPPSVSTINFRQWLGGAGGSISYTNSLVGLAIKVNSSGGNLTLGSSAGIVITIPAATLNTQFAGSATIASTVQSVSTNSGALQVTGGVGIGGNLYVGGTSTFTGDATFSSGSLTLSAASAGSTDSIAFRTGGTLRGQLSADSGVMALSANNSSGIRLLTNGVIGLTIDNSSIVTVQSNTNSSSTTTGALQVVGGVGIGGNLYVGGTINGNITGTVIGTASTATNIAGGAANQIPYQSNTGTTVFSSNLTWNNATQTLGITGFITTFSLARTGNINAAAWSTTSPSFSSAAALLTDITSAASTVVPIRVGHSFRSPNFAATNAITITDSVNLYVNGPVASTNVTQTNAWGIYNDSNEYIAGSLVVAGSNAYILGTTSAASTTTGALQVRGGVGIGGNLYVGGTINGNITGTVIGTASTATNIAGGAANQIPYQSSTGTTTFSSNLVFDGTNLGVGTSSPSNKLVVSNSGANGLEINPISGVSSGASINGYNRSTSAYTPVTYAALSHYFQVGSSPATAVTLDSSGNLGLGVTPSAWKTALSTKAIQVGPVGSFSSLQASSTNNQTYVASNAYLGVSDWIYLYSDLATHYRQYAGTHVWFTAPSGTAGNPITWTQAMTLDASGRLMVGGTSALGSVATFTGSSASVVIAQGSSTNYAGLRIYNDINSNVRSLEIDYSGSAFSGSLVIGGPSGEQAAITTTGAYPLVLGTANTARVVIDASGNLFLGGTSTAALDGVFGAVIGGTTKTSAGVAFESSLSQWLTYTEDTSRALIFWDSRQNTERARIDSSGNLLVGYTTQQSGAKLAVNGGVYVNGVVTATTFVGNITGTMTGTATAANNIAGGAANQIPYQSGAGSTTFSSNLTWNGTTLYVNGRLQNAGGLKTYSVSTVGQGNTNSVHEIMKISRDNLNWSTNTPYEITVYSSYYTSGGCTKWLLSYGYYEAGILTCTYAGGSGQLRVYLGAEVTVNANLQYRPVFVDLPPYMGASIEVRYSTTEVGSVGAINASGQVFFSNITTASGGTGSFYNGGINYLTSLTANTIVSKIAQDYVVSVTANSATTTLDLSQGNTFYVTMSASTTFAFSNIPTGSNLTNFSIITYNSAGGYAISWPAGVTWSGGQTPARTTTSGKSDIYTFFTLNAGSSIIGSLSILNY